MNGSPNNTNQGTREAILDAADAFLRDHPFRELTVSQIMVSTSVSRPAFYQYFRDRYEVASALGERIQLVVQESVSLWLDGGGGKEPCAESLRRLARDIAPHGYVMKALSDAACFDERLELIWRRGLADGTVARVAEMIKHEQETGLTPSHLDPSLTAHALAATIEYLVKERLGSPGVPDSVAEAVGQTWAAVWCSTLYPERP